MKINTLASHYLRQTVTSNSPDILVRFIQAEGSSEISARVYKVSQLAFHYLREYKIKDVVVRQDSLDDLLDAKQVACIGDHPPLKGDVSLSKYLEILSDSSSVAAFFRDLNNTFEEPKVCDMGVDINWKDIDLDAPKEVIIFKN